MAVMTRTSIMLPDALKRNAEKKARSLGISLGEYPFIRDTKTYLKKSPKDSSMEHDKYIYG